MSGRARTTIENPNHVTTEELKAHLRMRHLNIPQLEWMSCADTLAAFRKYAMPKPQRGQPAAALNVATTAAVSTKCVTIDRKRAPADDQRSRIDVDRMTGECKRIRIASIGENCERDAKPPDAMMETDAVNEASAKSAARCKHKPITWP